MPLRPHCRHIGGQPDCRMNKSEATFVIERAILCICVEGKAKLAKVF